MELMFRKQEITSRRRALRAALFGCTALAAVAFQAPAFAEEVKFSIAGQPLASALLDFGRQSGRQVVFTPATVAHLTTKGLVGSFEPMEALRRLSSGSSLVFTEQENGSFIVRPASASEMNNDQGSNHTAPAAVSPSSATPTEESAAPRPKIPVVAGGRESDAENTLASSELEEIVVQAKRRASTATKFELSVIDTPQSIKAVTTDVLDFASIHNFTDLEKIDASTSSKGVDFFNQAITFRGFDFSIEEGTKIDGAAALSTFPTDFIVFDRVEILKGPSSSVYGQNAVGGMVNAVLKRPMSTFGGFVGARVGSWGYHRVEGDVGGPLTDDGKLSFRAIAAYEEGGDFVDFGKNKSKVAYGTLKYDFDEATSATVIVEYQERIGTPPRGIAVNAGTFTVPNVPVSRRYSAPWTKFEGQYLHTEAEVNHKFSNNWLLKLNGQYGEATHLLNANGTFGLFDANGDMRNLGGALEPLHGYYIDSYRNQWSVDLSLTGDFDLFGHSNTFFVGVDHRVNKSNMNSINANYGFLNIFNPDYSVFNTPRVGPSDYLSDGYAYVYDDEREFWGGSVQLLLHPVDRLSVLLGARWDKSKITALWGNGQIVGNDVARVDDPWFDNVLNTTKLVPSVGVTYELQPSLNLYVNYGKSFVPQTGVTFEGKLIAPEEGYQFEGGIKGNFGQTTATLAIFDMTRTHIVGTDIEHPGNVIEIGTQRSKGVEVDVFGNVLPGWSVYGSFAYVDAKITATDRPADIGARLFNVPKYSLSLYSDYKIQKGSLAGLGFGGGVVTKQDRVWGLPGIGFIGRQVNPGGYTTVDLRVFYEIGNIMFDLKANNVLNEKYYVTAAPGLRAQVFAGRPREFVGSVKYKF